MLRHCHRRRHNVREHRRRHNVHEHRRRHNVREYRRSADVQNKIHSSMTCSYSFHLQIVSCVTQGCTHSMPGSQTLGATLRSMFWHMVTVEMFAFLKLRTLQMFLAYAYTCVRLCFHRWDNTCNRT